MTRWPLPTVLLAAVLAGCSAGDPTPTGSATVRRAAVATPVATPVGRPPRPNVDPLTGLAPRTAPVVAVKVDNAFLARPYQRGLHSAAVIYQELVEGGSTRLLAVLESGQAGGEVGPIRSVRESDIELLREYGPIGVGFSGGNTGVLATFGAAVRAGQLVDASYKTVPGAYRLGEQRADARNFFTSADALAGDRPGAGPRDIGLRFDTGLRFGPPAAGLPTATMTAVFSPQSSVRVRWDAPSTTWVLTQDGRALPVSPRNVIVQVVRVLASRYVDVHGEPTPYTVTKGGGAAYVLRDGLRRPGRWTRTGYGGTRFVDAQGRDLLLHTGPTYVILLPSGGTTAFD